MKKLLSFLLSIMLILSVVPMGLFSITASAVTATSGTTGDCTWKLDGTVLTISGNGAMGNYYGYGYTGFSLPWGQSVTEVIIKTGVTSIGEHAFAGCSELRSITIPDSATSIGNAAFIECISLTSVMIPGSITSIGDEAFNGCRGLRSITIPGSVTSIGRGAFVNCRRLTSVTIPESVTSIGNSTFSSCTGLTSVTIPNGVTNIENFAFLDCAGLTSVIIPGSVTSIGESAFERCTGLTSITIPNSVTSIGYFAFRDCTGLTSITIPDSVTSIGNFIFKGCRGLTSVTIPDSIKSIGTAFSGCTGLTSITIPNSVTSIGDYAFSDCTGLTNITIPSSVTSIGNYVFKGCAGLTSITIPNSITSIGDCAFYDCKGLTSITMPNSVTSIGYYAFKGCKGLTSITIPNSVTSIGSSAFYFCTGLTSITIPNSVTSIGDDVFYYCTGLTSITIPNSITSIGDDVFYYCTGLTSITIPDSVTSIGSRAFSGCTGITSITIPNSVTSIGGSAFSGCTGITNIAIPDSIKSIGNNAFSNCTNLNTVTLPQYAVNKLIFKNFKSIKNIILDKNVTNVDDYGFPGCTGLEKIYGYNNVADSYAKKNNLTFYSLDAPAAPKIKKIGINSIALEENAYYQYSMNGNAWQTGNVFENLSPNTEYKFYQRIYYADINRLTDASPALTAKTVQSKVDKPILIVNTTTDVVLKEIEGYEYSLYGITWQKSNVFSNLNPSTRYKFYQRIAETDVSSASGKSDALIVKTVISKKTDISTATVDIESQSFTGVPKCPAPNVIINGIQLKQNRDYIVKYVDNTEIGTGTAIIIGTNDYTGYCKGSFEITKQIFDTSSKEFNGIVNRTTDIKSGNVVVKGLTYITYTLMNSNGEPVEYKSGEIGSLSVSFKYLPAGKYYLDYSNRSAKAVMRMVNGVYKYVYEPYGPASYGSITINRLSENIYSTKPDKLIAEPQIKIDYKKFMLQVSSNTKNASLNNIKWSSNNSNCLSVDENGIVSVKKVGKATITAAIGDKTAKWEIDIEPIDIFSKINIISFEPEIHKICVGFDLEELRENIDYSVSYKETSNCVIATITGIGLFKNSFDVLLNKVTGEPCSAKNIKIINAPQKIEYRINKETLDLRGGKIEVTLNSGEKVFLDMKEYMVSGFDNSKSGKQTLKVTFANQSTTFDINIKDYKKGDLNNDNKINSLDGLLLLRYLNGWDVETVSPDAMDINGDSKVNSLDGLLLLRYLNGWDIDLGEETDPTPPSGGETENPNPPSEDDDKSWSAAEVATLKVSSNSIATDVSDFLVACVTFKAFISAGGVYGKEQATIKATEIKSSILKIRNQVNSLYELVESRNDISYLDKDGKTYYLRQAYETAKSITDNLYSRNISGTSTLAESEEYVNLAQELWKACTLMNDIAKSV